MSYIEETTGGSVNATTTIRMKDYEKEALTEYATFLGMSFSEWARQTLCGAYEDAMDYQIAAKALEEYEKNPVSYSAEEAARLLGDADLLGGS